MASDLNPDRTSVIRVMTPHPDTVRSSMTILEALKKMHDNHYLHLPVVDDHGQMAGLVDVLQVSFAMLNQMNTIQGDSSSEGPVWNKFWESSFTRDETGSEVSASDIRSGFIPASDAHYGDSNSIVESTARFESSVGPLAGEGTEFIFKFKESSGQVHRFSSSTRSFAELYDKIVEKMGLEAGSDVTMSYCDEENDQVLILQDADIVDAVQMAYRNQLPLIRLSVTASSKTKEVKKSSSGEKAAAGLDPVILSGAVGLGVGLVIAIAFTMMRK